MSNNWLKRLVRAMFPSDSDRHEAGVGFGKKHFADAKTEAECDMLRDGLPLEAHDPFDQGIMQAYREQLALIKTFDTLGPRPGPLSDNLPAWAQGPLPIAEEFISIRGQEEDLAKELSRLRRNASCLVNSVLLDSANRPYMTDARGVPVKPRFRVKAGRRVI